jgi:hypothetical protein
VFSWKEVEEKGALVSQCAAEGVVVGHGLSRNFVIYPTPYPPVLSFFDFPKRENHPTLVVFSIQSKLHFPLSKC